MRMRIITTTFWKQPRLIAALLANCFTLDPSVLLLSHTLYVLQDKNATYGFIAVKYHSKNVLERGSLYVYPRFRGKGYGKRLMKHVLAKHKRAYVLCKQYDQPFKEKQGFQLIHKAPFALAYRRFFYNALISSITKNKIIIMCRKKS